MSHNPTGHVYRNTEYCDRYSPDNMCLQIWLHCLKSATEKIQKC